MSCSVTFTLTQDITSPLNLYYQLTNFYQNHRRYVVIIRRLGSKKKMKYYELTHNINTYHSYVKSRSDDQCGGKYVAPLSTALQTSCDPDASWLANVTAPNGTNKLAYYPCGLIATSFFNDRIDLAGGPTGSSVDETNIAWPVDLQYKFLNPNPQATNKWNEFLYLWQTYDQMSCYHNVTGVRGSCYTWNDLIPGTFGKGCAKCPEFYTPKSEGGIPPPGGWQAFDPHATTIPQTAPFGVRDEHFVVWMRTAGLPTFRKLYGVVKPASGTTFKKGDTLTFNIVPNFEVGSFGGTKSLVLSTATPIGGKSDVMAIAYLVVGSLCAALGIAFLIKHIVAPRKLGDTSNIVWRQGAKTA
jgi:hypothetical protein